MPLLSASLPPPRRPAKLLVATLLTGTSARLISPTGAFFITSTNHNEILGEVRSASPTPHFPRAQHLGPLPATANDNENDSYPDDGMMRELSQRITDLTEREESASQAFEAGLQRRVRSVRSSDDLEAKASQSGTAHLPAVAFDQLLPRQRLSGRTSDPTFGRMLRDLGLGGLFVMVSVDARARKVRRNGVVARIEYVDVDSPETSSWGGVGPGGEAPTAVDFCVVGRSRCRIVGPCTDMVARIGRWRRAHDPDGEEAVLGFAEERFLDSPFGVAAKVNGGADFEHDIGEWTPVKIDCALVNESREEVTQDTIDKAESIAPLLDRWVELASNTKTYDNIDVVATARIKTGEPGLHNDPEKHIRGVLKDIGERPSSDLNEFCFWGAALINPLPPLGVSLEVRGRMLEAKSINERLDLLQRTVERSIQNLEGTRPL